MKITIVALVLCCVAYIVADIPVEQCQTPTGPQVFKQTIKISHCRKPPCRLQKKTIIKGEYRFTPDRNVEKITNTINAIIVGLPFPFIGVDDTDACDQIFDSDATTKVGCPLKAGKEYVYVNQFEIREIYPRIKFVVHWALTGNDGKDVMCFEVAARITD